LAGVVDDGDLLSDVATSRDSELELGLDLLRNRRELVLVQPDVCPVQGLEDDVAGVGGWLRRVAGQLEDIR
jgi:hypothetical protein